MDETTYVPSGIECDCGVQMEYDGDKLICFFCGHSEYPDDELIEILAAQPLRAVDAASALPAEQNPRSNIVPAVEFDTQPRP